jgi:hypothetical protein
MSPPAGGFLHPRLLLVPDVATRWWFPPWRHCGVATNAQWSFCERWLAFATKAWPCCCER